MKHKKDPALKGKRELALVEVPIPKEAQAGAAPGSKSYKLGKCVIILESLPQRGCHIAVMHPNRWPNYEEMKAASKLAPSDAAMALLFPEGETPTEMTGGKRVLHLNQVGRRVQQQQIAKAQILTPQNVRSAGLRQPSSGR